MPRSALRLLVVALLASAAFGACRPEQPPAEPPIPSHPISPASSGLAYLTPTDELDASIAPESGPILDANALPGYDVHPVGPSP